MTRLDENIRWEKKLSERSHAQAVVDDERESGERDQAASDDRKSTAKDIVRRDAEGKPLTPMQQKFLDGPSGRLAVLQQLIDLGVPNPHRLHAEMIKEAADDLREKDKETDEYKMRADIRLKYRRFIANELSKLTGIEDGKKPDDSQRPMIFEVHGDLIVRDPENTEPVRPVREAETVDPGSDVV